MTREAVRVLVAMTIVGCVAVAGVRPAGDERFSTALEPLGGEYVDSVKKGLDSRWIDVPSSSPTVSRTPRR